MKSMSKPSAGDEQDPKAALDAKSTAPSAKMTHPSVKEAARPGKGGKTEPEKYYDGMFREGATSLREHDTRAKRTL